jgi:Ca2+-binding RTX toxin-like protein
MVKVKYAPVFDSAFPLDAFYEHELALRFTHPDEALYQDLDSFWMIDILGKNLEAHNGIVDHGKITSITFKDWHGDAAVRVTGNFDAKAITKVLVNSGVEAALGKILAGDDKITGSGKDNYLDGLGGNDTLNGGKGADTFYLHAGSGKDTVSDYFGTGDDNSKWDGVFVSDGSQYHVKDTARGAVVQLDTGDRMLLVGVDAADVHVYVPLDI